MQYSGINAKIKAMKGILLCYEDFEYLSTLKTVEGIGKWLREHPSYKKALGTLGGQDMRRGSIEHSLNISLMDDFSRMYAFISDFNCKKYAEAYILRYEINILQLMLSMAFDERDISYSFPDAKGLLGGKLKIDIPRLAVSKNVPEFLENLKNTQYYSVLDGAYTTGTSLFEMETKLDIYYYIHLWRLQNKYLDKNNIRVLSTINGTEIDLRNLMWLYRLKKHYRIGVPAIYSCLIPIQFNLNRQQISAMAEAKTENEFLSEFMDTKYGKSLLASGDIERNFNIIMSRLYKSSEIRNQNSLAGFGAYLHKKSQEISNLTKLIESVRYGLEPKDIIPRLYVPSQWK